VILGSSSFWALNQLAHDYTGASIVARSAERWGRVLSSLSFSADGLPTEKARANRALIEAELARREAEKGQGRGQKNGVLERLWMGDEEEGWKERRLKEEEEALKSGKSYWDLISEQVSEVWSGKGKKKEKEEDEEGKEKEKGEEEKKK
jgi:hypothetical protein